MKVSGFTFVKNAVTYDYPVMEAITSILPICDEFVVAVGDSDDGTMELIRSIDSDKIRIVETVWDESMKEGGRILAVETDKAFAKVSKDSDWAFYLQADEVVHEKYLATIMEAMVQHRNDPTIDGLLFKYHHFFASYDYIGVASRWYENEIRVIKNDKSIYSYRDAQGFRKGENEKLIVKPIDAFIYHYGWVRDSDAMQRKVVQSNEYGYTDKEIQEETIRASSFDYISNVDELTAFTESHPQVMKDRIAQKNWKFEYDLSKGKKSVKDKFKIFCKNYLGLDFYYRNYKIRK